MTNLDNPGKDIKEFIDYLYNLQNTFEEIHDDGELVYQSIRVKQRISALLDIYSQIICEGRKFNEDYLKQYLGGK